MADVGIRRGRVFLVGAGPGDPDLITVRGAACLAAADVVLYDYLVNPVVLRHARAGAERTPLGHAGGQRAMDPEEVRRRLVAAARDGKTVVRLKSGDPSIFGRAADEIAALRAAGIEYEIVPGVTAALAAAGYAELPLTHGGQSSAVALVTGAERAGKPVELDYAALAAFPGTLVFYMGVTTAEGWAARLIAAGKPAHTPAAVVRRATWSDQQTVRTTLGELAAELARRRVRPPAVIVVGEVAAAAPAAAWFERRPLFGLRVLVTRPRDQAGELAAALGRLGAEVVLQPTIEIGPPDDWAPVDRAIARLADFDWLVFSSSNGVRALLDRLLLDADMRRLGRLRLAAIGPGTADELARYRLRADLVPEEFRAESLAAALAPQAAGGKFLLVRASRGRELLAEELAAAGATVEQVVAYSNRDVPRADPAVVAQMGAGRIDWVTVTSSSIAASLAAMFGEGLRAARLASISPVTSATLRQVGFEPAAEARQYTIAGLVAALVAAAAGGDGTAAEP